VRWELELNLPATPHRSVCRPARREVASRPKHCSFKIAGARPWPAWIIRGDKALARAYAVDVQAVYDHYNFRAVAKAMKEDGHDVIDVMKDPKTWQAAWFHGDKALELDFWLG
jgi:hypothetical protein